MPPRSTLPAPKSRPPPASSSSHAHSSAHPSYTNAPKPSGLSTSRPVTPSSHSRKSAPQSRNESPAKHQREPMEKAPFTPSPRPQRKRRGNQPSNQRSESEPQPASPEEEDAALFDLLGVAPPPKKAEPEPQLESRRGVIVLPEGEGLNGTKKQKNRRKNKKTPEEDIRDDGLPRDQAESSRRKKKPVKPMLTETFSAPAQQLSQPSSIDSLMASATKNSPPFSTSSPKPRSRDVKRAENDGAYETASLSKSLPADVDGVSLMASGVRTKKGKKEDESAVWDMPEGSGSQTLTWQQKLAQTETPPRNSRKGFATERKPKSKLSTLYNPSTASNSSSRPSHGRRLSYDSLAQPYHLSQPSITALPPALQRENPSLSGVPISAFDGHIPFHTGYNVHRAPQTPAKTVATAHGNLLNGDGSLPLIPGEFPRLQSEGSGSGSIGSAAGGKGMGMKYAGPTFHNSPHAATLSKPDMEDF
ncbi:hypothetical protein B9479_004646 [Cryptococcus floricola]|uniref:Uncharacterized protein n=1 Tax=Cryptococcus floricola TaxID=2591691 RepID=A0A5D3AXX5_9TREE|nr:hypothetical protein B9479_004646 [Cryptococcus floricola]